MAINGKKVFLSANKNQGWMRVLGGGLPVEQGRGGRQTAAQSLGEKSAYRKSGRDRAGEGGCMLWADIPGYLSRVRPVSLRAQALEGEAWS